ncbi:MAG: hypothetical protein KA149_03910 [Chitinophagales bacterium]|nr:hypothetical protein [Chitinophagales bacterium]
MNNLFKPLLILSILALGLFSSCKRTCDLGYEGKHCPTEIREKYLGTFAGTRTCETTSGTDTVAIQGLTDDVTTINFQYINGQARNVKGETRPDGTLAIPEQIFGQAKITGSTSIENGKIKITYTIVYNSPDSVTKNCVWIQN